MNSLPRGTITPSHQLRAEGDHHGDSFFGMETCEHAENHYNPLSACPSLCSFPLWRSLRFQ